MNRSAVWLPLVLGALFAPSLFAPSLFALPEPTADELKANRAQLEQWRKHPEQLARLRRDLAAFLALPAERREQIYKLDDDLQQDPAAPRLVSVLERYASWLGRLPEADRRAIASTANVSARLAHIQDLRDREWMQTQPRSMRDQWEALAGEPRTKFVRVLRQNERNRREEWQLAGHFWKELHDSRPPATRLSELSDEDREGVKEYLMPMLSQEEKDRLRKVEGKWPGYLIVLVEIADQHPLALPGVTGPQLMQDLPQAVQQRLKNTRIKHPTGWIPVENQVLAAQKQKWSRFAETVVASYRDHVKRSLPRELWAYNDDCLLPPMREYMKRLRAVLTDKEQERLRNATNNWPAYPIAIQELADAHELPAPPWNTALAGPRERWDAYRTANDTDVLAVPRQVLQEFALNKLEPAKLAEFKKLPAPEMWKQFRSEFMRQMAAHAQPKMQHADAKEKGKGRRYPFAFGHDKH